MGLLNFFPFVYHEEDFRSIILRYHKISSNKNILKTQIELFESKSSSISVFPTSINKLLEKVIVTSKIEISDIPINNTLLPIFIPFLDAAKLVGLKRSMYDGVGNCTSRMQEDFISKDLRYCTKCMEEDVSTFGEVYIHRLHQLKFIKFCYKHLISLSSVEEVKLLNSDEINELRSLECTDIEISLKKKLLQDIIYLIENPIDQETLLARFITVLGCKGFISHKGDYYKRELIKSLLENTPSEIIEEFELDSFLQRDYIQLLLNRNSMSRCIIVYLLLMRFLSGCAESFFKEDIVYAQDVPLGNGPWKCQNSVCNNKNIKTIKRNIMGIKSGEVRIEISCSDCGFTYICRSSKVKSIKVINYGWLWVETIVKGYLNNEKVKNIASSLEIDQVYIYAHIKKIEQLTGGDFELALKFPKELSNELSKYGRNNFINKATMRNKYRKEIIEIIKKLPENKRIRSEINNTNKKVYLWLFRHDNEWLQKILPDSRIGQTKLDFQTIDQELAIKVTNIALELPKDKLLRITKLTILNKLERLDKSRVLRHINNLPITVAALENAIESNDQFALRCFPMVLEKIRKRLKNFNLEDIKRYFVMYRDISNDTEKKLNKKLEQLMKN